MEWWGVRWGVPHTTVHTHEADCTQHSQVRRGHMPTGTVLLGSCTDCFMHRISLNQARRNRIASVCCQPHPPSNNSLMTNPLLDALPPKQKLVGVDAPAGVPQETY